MSRRRRTMNGHKTALLNPMIPSDKQPAVCLLEKTNSCYNLRNLKDARINLLTEIDSAFREDLDGVQCRYTQVLKRGIRKCPVARCQFDWYQMK